MVRKSKPVVEGINPSHLYPIETLKKLMGWSTSSYRSAVRRGLKVLRDGKRGFVRGADVVEWLSLNDEGDDS